MDPRSDQNHIETLHETRFLSLYDLQYAEGRHYYVASRRTKDDLVAVKSGQEAKKMLPDAVTIAVVIRLPGEDPKLLLFYEYRYPAGRFLLSPVAGLIDEADRKDPDPLVTAAVREIREEIGLTVSELLRNAALRPPRRLRPPRTPRPPRPRAPRWPPASRPSAPT